MGARMEVAAGTGQAAGSPTGSTPLALQGSHDVVLLYLLGDRFTVTAGS